MLCVQTQKTEIRELCPLSRFPALLYIMECQQKERTEMYVDVVSEVRRGAGHTSRCGKSHHDEVAYNRKGN